MRYIAKLTLVWGLGAALLALPLGGCKHLDDYTERPEVERPKTEEFRLLSVRSTGRGEAVELDFDMNLEGELRALAYQEEAATGAVSGVTPSVVETVYCALRKKGAPASLFYVTLQWTGRTGGRVSLPRTSVQLPAGETMTSGDEWYISAVLGADGFDAASGTVRLGPEGGSEEMPALAPATVNVPHIAGWTRLSITTGATTSAHPVNLVFRPQGTLLRLQYYSDLLEDHRIRRLTLRSNALRTRGTFALSAATDAELESGALPAWSADISDSDPAAPAQANSVYTLEHYPDGGMLLPAAQGYAPERTYYLWGMPTQASAANTGTTVEVEVTNAASSDADTRITYAKEKHRPMLGGKTYRLSNVLTSDLLISEVYYQYAPKIDGSTEHTTNRNYSIVEIYNPTASAVDLSQYALVRLTHDNASGYVFFCAGEVAPNADINRAATLPLGVVAGDGGNVGGFRSNGTGYSGAWHKTLYGTPSTMLEPGKTLLIGAAGYVHTAHKPGENVLRYNTAVVGDASVANDPARIRALERHYLPRAGMQADSAVRAGFAQTMVAIDNNNHSKDRDPNPNGRGAVLQLGNGQGVALIKSTVTSAGTAAYTVIDTSMPIGSAAAATAYRTALLTHINSAVSAGESLSTLDYNRPMSYSVVRTSAASRPSATHKADEWVVSATENAGIKSLGTRNYVAGLTPFAPNYTGYNSTNNPDGRPFWAGQAFIPNVTKGWTRLPGTGDNVFDPNIDQVKGRYAQITVTTAHATEQQAAYPIELSIDGSTDTFYHSKNRGDNPNFPITLTYNFATAESLSHIVYIPRDYNGSFGNVDITVTYEDGSTATVVSKDFGFPLQATQITWEGIAERKVRSVAFKVKNTGYGVVSVREMQFYKQREDYFDPTAFFVDAACTQLRSNVTYAEIMRIENTFFREMIRKMYQGVYEREFRITTKPMLVNPDTERQYNKTQFGYSRYNGATGISVKQGERLIVFCDAPGVQKPILLVQNLGTHGYGGVEHKLEQGMNIITPDRSGLVYIIYNTNSRTIDRTVHPDAKLHFATGTVNGYFDASDPQHAGRWRELLGKATDRYFDILGVHAHATFPTAKFRELTPNGDYLVEQYDKVVVSEMEMMGLYKYNRVFTNRAYFMHDKDGGMWATSYRTGYRDAMPLFVVDGVDGFKRWNWGIGHEQGHQNQTVGLNWGGMIEVTVNIPALYIEESVFGTTSRSIAGDWYTKAWNDLLRTSASFSTKSQASSSLIAFWQLELYFGRVLGRTPMQQGDKGGFYPDLYERLRQFNTPQPNNAVNNGIQQTNFALHASVVSGYDLTEFFEKWGFFRLTNNEVHYNTYNHANYLTVTADMVSRVKGQIQALSLPQLPVALEYITSENWRMYQTPRAVVAGTASRNVNTCTMQGWQNVVAWEVRNSGGELVYTAAGRTTLGATTNTFTIDRPWQADYVVNAIAADGTRTRVNL